MHNTLTILLSAVILVLLLYIILMHRRHIKQESELMDSLQNMLENAINGKILDVSFKENKQSYLENRMSHYLQSQAISYEQLQKQKEFVLNMVTDISHQSTTPISNILLYTELISEKDNSAAYELNIIKEETEKLDFLIQALVKSARLETGLIRIHPKNESVNTIFETIKTQYERAAKNKGILFYIEPASVRANFDLKWTVEAISNIVDNAVKYTPNGGKISIQAIPYPMFARIDVTDTGRGIPEEEHAKVFSRFYRSLDVQDQPGIGIGLYLSREIIQMEKGYIKLESQKGQGSKFSIFLPMQ